jgi:hypothetical protein
VQVGAGNDEESRLLWVDLGPVSGGPVQDIRGFVRPVPHTGESEESETQSGIQVIVFETPDAVATPSPEA